MIAQTWSEHCKHKIFNATIRYRENGRGGAIDSLFRTYIRATTEAVAGKRRFLRSVFHDNSGVIAFDRCDARSASRWRRTTLRPRWTPTAGPSRASSG